MRIVLPWSLVAVASICCSCSCNHVQALVGRRRPAVTVARGPFVIVRGGGQSHHHPQQEQQLLHKDKKNVTLALERYVAAKEEQDRQECQDDYDQESVSSSDDTSSAAASTSTTATTCSRSKQQDAYGDDDAAAVGVKHHHKKSNAVGDPDGNSSDDDNDDTDNSSEWEEFLEEMQELGLNEAIPPPSKSEEPNKKSETPCDPQQLQVEMELVSEQHPDSASSTSSFGGGNVGVRLANRLAGRKSTTNQKTTKNDTSKTTTTTSTRSHQAALLEAWLPHVYLPLEDTNAYLVQHARSMDASSKSRLDRRTLYGSLLLEWQHQLPSSRKFLTPSTSQQLQAALSLATQPQWRKSFPQANCISLNDESSTLAMQETIAMGLAHSLGCGMVILDDAVLESVRQELQKDGMDDEKPALLLQHLLELANNGKLNTSQSKPTKQQSGLISNIMERELALGLDDPFDERAISSISEMKEWEETTSSSNSSSSIGEAVQEKDALPLVLFVRTESSTSLLKSKSAVEQLLQECTSSDSIHLVVLGKGIDATTETLPFVEQQQQQQQQQSFDDIVPAAAADSSLTASQQPQGVGPWFGFSPQNQNASGQNDPEGSRRFNIFLARTTDASGTPGILGAIAPPQAGNLFPHMMALQAKERLQQQQKEGVDNASMEQWAQQMLQQQMQGNQPFAMPQFFNATLASSPQQQPQQQQQPPPQLPPQVVQHALQHAMSDLLDRLAQMSQDEDQDDDDDEAAPLHPDLHRAFGQVLRNENLRRGIAENLARAAPALTDPKCQGVMLSVYVPPPPHHHNFGKLPGKSTAPQLPGTAAPPKPSGGWFHKILNSAEQHANNNNHHHQDDDEEKSPSVLAEEEELEEEELEEEESDGGSSRKKRSFRKNRLGSLAAALGPDGSDSDEEHREIKKGKAERNLQKLETLCRRVPVKTPADPVRRKSWENWIARERGAVVFRQNRRALNAELQHRRLQLQERTGTRGVGSSLRQMLSVRNVSDEMQDVIKCAVELEAAKSQKHAKATSTTTKSPDSTDTVSIKKKPDRDFEMDVSLHQLLINDDDEESDSLSMEPTEPAQNLKMQYLHPSSLESALALTCRLNPSPSGGLSVSSSSTPASHRSREDILALAQDKHERALVSQVVSPQDIGVTYDMIGGLNNVKELLRQSITYPLKFPHLYSEGIAREAVKGVLLFGPPGTGKTMLAKAVATEGGASFLSVDASSVENKWLGESEKNAKAVFTLARRLAPCVIFIDEVDSLLSSREGSSDDSAHGTLTSVKTTMMSEWDGLNSGTNGNGEAGSDRVVVIGSTNRPFDLDEAVLRRFPRRILVDLPDLETRTEILEVTLAENRLDPAVNLTSIAERLDGYTGSDIKEVCREAVVQISHEQARLVDQGATESADFTQGSLQRLRPVTMDDFEKSLSKLKKSVSERGRELSRVWEWNDEYGEIKREKRDHLPNLMNMFL